MLMILWLRERINFIDNNNDDDDDIPNNNN